MRTHVHFGALEDARRGDAGEAAADDDDLGSGHDRGFLRSGSKVSERARRTPVALQSSLVHRAARPSEDSRAVEIARVDLVERRCQLGVAASRARHSSVDRSILRSRVPPTRTALPTPAERAAELAALERAVRREIRWVYARAVVLCVVSVAIALAAIGWSVHSTDEANGPDRVLGRTTHRQRRGSCGRCFATYNRAIDEGWV